MAEKNTKSGIIASVSGVRGIYGDTLTPENIVKFTSAFVKLAGKNKSRFIVTGYDGRYGGESVYNLVKSVISMSGLQSYNIGIAPTPTVQLAVEKIKAAGGIVITASHNPQEWNGLKFLGPDGTFLSGKEMEAVKKLTVKNDFKYAASDSIAPEGPEFNEYEMHIDAALNLKYIKPEIIRKRKFKVVVDAVNASGSFIVPELLKELGCTVYDLHCDMTGIFPHVPEPLPKNLASLSRFVIDTKSDIGIAVDPDADRLVLITEKGEPFIEENTVTTAVNFILKHSRKKNNLVTVNLSTTRAVDDIARKYGAAVKRTPVGEINVVSEMKKNGSVCGGEGSGGVIIPPALGGHFGRDSLLGIAVILQELAESNLTVSEYKDTLPKYRIEKRKIKIVENPGIYLRKIIQHNKKSGCKITTTDGVKLDFENYWIHYRKSNTEPIIRIIKETKIS